MTQTLEQQLPRPSPPTYKKPWIRTPLIESAALSRAAGCRIFLKLENLQPSGSFKSRGIGNLILKSQRKDGATPHFYCSSGGNAGLAAVTAARSLHQPCTVVVPMTCKPEMVAKLQAAGATDVIQIGASWYEADKHLREVCLAGDKTGVYVPPFDHEWIWEGHGGLVGEVKEQMDAADGEPDAFVCSVGGGGLFNGIAAAVDTQYLSRPRIVAVETQGCDSLNAALRAREHIGLEKITSLATSLGCMKVCERTWQLAQQKNVSSVTVSDAEAALGCWRFADDERTLVELACGASLVLAYNGGLRKLISGFSAETKVVLVVCGGSNVSLQQLADYREMFGEEAESTIARNGHVPSAYTAPTG